jgi:hypothetical protein
VSVTRVKFIYECYTASMKYLSKAVEVPVEEMGLWGIFEWRQLNLVLMLCAKSVLVLDSTYCTVESSERATWLGKCLDTLAARAKELHVMTARNLPHDQTQAHFLDRMANDWSNIKTYFRTCVQSNQPEPPSQISATTTMVPSNLQQYLPIATTEISFDFDAFNEAYWLDMNVAEIPGLINGWQL